MWIVDRLLTWLNGQTLGTQVWTARHGTKVGEDEQGNLYYQTPGGTRRWVIFNGEAEASRVPPDWRGWLTHTHDDPPSKVPLPRATCLANALCTTRSTGSGLISTTRTCSTPDSIRSGSSSSYVVAWIRGATSRVT